MGVRTYDCIVEDDKGRAISNAWCRAYNVTDMANPVQVEEQYTNALGVAAFVALPDNAPVDVQAIWGKTVKWFRNVFGSGGDDVDSAVGDSHVQNTDSYAAGYRTGTSFPGTPGEGEMYVRTDL